MGLDLAKEAVKNYKLPPIEKEEDVLDYPTAKVIDLCYRIGILSRPEWRRLHRSYEIRRDLEHEDDEYEAVLEDCLYIFKSSIDIVLSQDPIHLLKVTDVKQPDIVRGNAFELLRNVRPLTKPAVTIEIAKHIEEKLGTKELDLTTAKIAHACGAAVYFKKARLRDFYASLFEKFEAVGTRWDSFEKHGPLLESFEDIGALEYCPDSLLHKFVKWIVETYIGEPGGYGTWGRNRAVFYSDTASPIISRIVRNSTKNISAIINDLRKDKDISFSIKNKYVLRRFENLIDLASKQSEE